MAESNDATVKYKVEDKAADGDVVIKSPAKNRLKGTKLTPDAHKVKTRQPIFFERAATSWWNPCFDSDILEKQYLKNYYNTTRRRFQVGLVYIAVACLAWVIYFGALKLNNWPMYLGGAVACCVLAVIVLILTVTPLYQKFFTPIVVVISIIVCSFLLLSAQTFTEADLSPVAGFTGTAEILILMYTLIPLPLFVAIIIGLVHSAVFEILSVVSGLSSLGYIAGRILLHLCIHLIGVHIYYISQARKRSTFLKVGQSIMSRCDLAIEKQLKQRMIHSLMPPTVAEEVMKANVKEEKDNEDLAARRPSAGPSQGQIRFRNFHMSQMSDVSILFADIVGFTKMSSNKTAEHLVSLLNDLFGRFDVLCDKSNCEKISTLGDCYYCVSGCPLPRADHAHCCIEMGMGMCRAIQEFDSDHNEEVNMRVGVHTGDVLCGLVGTRRFKFDVFSNDVTLANMMESEGAPGRVHISECTLAFIENDYDVEPAKEVPDIRKHKVLIEDYNTQTQQYQVRHVQEQTTLKTFFVMGKKQVSSPTAQSPTSPQTTQTKASDGSAPASTDAVALTIADPKSDSKGAEPEISSDGQTNHVADQDTNGVNSTLLLGQREALATSVEDISGEKLVEEVRDLDNETVLLKRIAETRVASDQTDLQLVDNMNESKEVEEYLHQPPINPCTLNFVNSKFEEAYREHYRESKREGSQTLASPRISACWDMVMSLIFFVFVSIACFISMPVRLPWIIFFAIAMAFEILMLVPILIDICVGSRNLPRIIKTFSAWLPRHTFGGFLALLPILAVFANFSCQSFDEKLGSDMFLCLAVMVSLLHFCNFTMLSSWIKSSLALLGGIVLLALILAGVCHHQSDSHGINTTDATVTTMMMEPHHQIFDGEHPFIYEIVLDVLLLVCLVVYLNRDFEINYRLSFHGDFQAQRDRKKMQVEKEQADWLLQNIIPQHVSDILKKTSKYSRNYNDVGVVFAKISNFDEFYDESFEGGKEYLRVLNEILGDMEDLFDDPKYKDVEKIKSIGPCLMVASGLDPLTRSQNEDPNAHLYALMDFAVELLQKMDQFNAEIFNFDFELTIGYNFGDVTAGVIGTTKLLYDIWGDTVNVASRMYSTGVYGKIQVTEDCVRKLEEKFDFAHRGQTFVKGKGDLNTFLLVKKKDGATWK